MDLSVEFAGFRVVVHFAVPILIGHFAFDRTVRVLFLDRDGHRAANRTMLGSGTNPALGSVQLLRQLLLREQVRRNGKYCDDEPHSGKSRHGLSSSVNRFRPCPPNARRGRRAQARHRSFRETPSGRPGRLRRRAGLGRIDAEPASARGLAPGHRRLNRTPLQRTPEAVNLITSILCQQ